MLCKLLHGDDRDSPTGLQIQKMFVTGHDEIRRCVDGAGQKHLIRGIVGNGSSHIHLGWNDQGVLLKEPGEFRDIFAGEVIFPPSPKRVQDRRDFRDNGRRGTEQITPGAPSIKDACGKAGLVEKTAHEHIRIKNDAEHSFALPW